MKIWNTAVATKLNIFNMQLDVFKADLMADVEAIIRLVDRAIDMQ